MTKIAKIHGLKCLGSAIALLCLVSTPLRASEKGGLQVEVQKVSLNRNELGYNSMGLREINRNMALRVSITNSSVKPLPETTLEYTILIQRWTSEKGAVERYTGTQTLPAMKPLESGNPLIGNYLIGGHMHGSSERHVDHVVGWKIVIVRDDQKLEFQNGPTFDKYNQFAAAGG